MAIRIVQTNLIEDHLRNIFDMKNVWAFTIIYHLRKTSPIPWRVTQEAFVPNKVQIGPVPVLLDKIATAEDQPKNIHVKFQEMFKESVDSRCWKLSDHNSLTKALCAQVS